VNKNTFLQTLIILSIFFVFSYLGSIAPSEGGFNLNSSLSIRPVPGEYFVRVRHYSPLETGTYEVGVKRV